MSTEETPGQRLLRRSAIAVLVCCFVLNMAGRGAGDTYIVFLASLEKEFGVRIQSQQEGERVLTSVNGIAAFLVEQGVGKSVEQHVEKGKVG